MKPKKYIVFICIILVMAGNWSFAPVSGDDWKTLSKEEAAGLLSKARNYNKEEVISMKMTYTSFEDHEGIKMADKKTGYYLKQNNNYFYRIGPVSVVHNKKYTISVDTVNKIMIISDSKKAPSLCDSQLDYERYLKNSSSILFKESGTSGIMKIAAKDGTKDFGYEVYMEKKTEVKEIRIFYGTKIKRNPAVANSYMVKPRLDIHVDSYSLKPVIAGDQFDEARFFSIEKSKIISKGNYSGYRILDQRVSEKIKNKK